MFLIDDILLAPAKGLMWIAKEIQKAASKAEENEADELTARLSSLYMQLETGQLTSEQFDAMEREILDRLDAIQGQGGTAEDDAASDEDDDGEIEYDDDGNPIEPEALEDSDEEDDDEDRTEDDEGEDDGGLVIEDLGTPEAEALLGRGPKDGQNARHEVGNADSAENAGDEGINPGEMRR
jgi:hypothetical protein